VFQEIFDSFEAVCNEDETVSGCDQLGKQSRQKRVIASWEDTEYIDGGLVLSIGETGVINSMTEAVHSWFLGPARTFSLMGVTPDEYDYRVLMRLDPTDNENDDPVEKMIQVLLDLKKTIIDLQITPDVVFFNLPDPKTYRGKTQQKKVAESNSNFANYVIKELQLKETFEIDEEDIITRLHPLNKYSEVTSETLMRKDNTVRLNRKEVYPVPEKPQQTEPEIEEAD
jgi:hypothetical protein